MGPPSQRIANPMIFFKYSGPSPNGRFQSFAKQCFCRKSLGSKTAFATWQTITKQMKALRNAFQNISGISPPWDGKWVLELACRKSYPSVFKAHLGKRKVALNPPNKRRLCLPKKISPWIQSTKPPKHPHKSKMEAKHELLRIRGIQSPCDQTAGIFTWAVLKKPCYLPLHRL